MGVLWMLLPDSALPLILLGLSLALMFGLVGGRTILGFLGMLLLFPVLAPLVEILLSRLPAWVSLIILVAFGLAFLRGVAALLIGQRAADTMVGSLAADVVRLLVAILFFPLRIAQAALRMLVNERELR